MHTQQLTSPVGIMHHLAVVNYRWGIHTDVAMEPSIWRSIDLNKKKKLRNDIEQNVTFKVSKQHLVHIFNYLYLHKLRFELRFIFIILLHLFREQEAKFVQDRISNVEKHFAELCTTFAAYTRKAARFVHNNSFYWSCTYRLFLFYGTLSFCV